MVRKLSNKQIKKVLWDVLVNLSANPAVLLELAQEAAADPRSSVEDWDEYFSKGLGITSDIAEWCEQWCANCGMEVQGDGDCVRLKALLMGFDRALKVAILAQGRFFLM